MADEQTRQLTKDLESLQKALEAATPAQIPLLEDVVDEEDLQRHAPQARKRAPRSDPGSDPQPPRTGDLFDRPNARDQLRRHADRLVDDLVAEYSSEIIKRLRNELTEQLHALLEDLEIDSEEDDDSPS